MSLWDLLTSWWDKDREHLIVHWIDSNAAVPAVEPVAAVADIHYFRVKLAEMFLNKQVAWFQGLYPAVQSLTRCNFGNGLPVEIPYIADSTKLGIPASGGQGDISAYRFVLVPTMPFNGGSVTVNLGLVALTGGNYLNRVLITLGSFADLLAQPQLSAALGVARPLASGIQELFGMGNGRLHLGYRDTFDAANLKSGYVAVVRATEKQVPLNTLRVVDDHLVQQVGQGSERLKGYDYMLLKFEILANRDDWAKLTDIDTPFQAAVRLLEQGQAKAASNTLQKAILAAWQAHELTEAHREIVVNELKKRFAARKEALSKSGLEELEPLTLQDIMADAPTPNSAPAKPMTAAEALAEFVD